MTIEKSAPYVGKFTIPPRPTGYHHRVPRPIPIKSKPGELLSVLKA